MWSPAAPAACGGSEIGGPVTPTRIKRDQSGIDGPSGMANNIKHVVVCAGLSAFLLTIPTGRFGSQQWYGTSNKSGPTLMEIANTPWHPIASQHIP